MFEERHIPSETDASALHPNGEENPASDLIPELVRGHPRPEGFQVPGEIWGAMFACYAVFFTAVALATGGSGPARMMLAISGLFILAYFTMASILGGLTGIDRKTVAHDRPLQTIYGPLSLGEVRTQILTVPFALVLFGLSILLISSLSGI